MWPANALTKRLNLKWPILQVPMGSASTPGLAAAVSNAGGLGGLGMWGRSADQAERRIAGQVSAPRHSRAPTDRPGGAAGWPSCLSPGSALGDDGVAQHADAAVDLDLDDIARFHPQGRLTGKADPLRRTGRDHVAGHERRPIRAVRDQSRDVEEVANP